MAAALAIIAGALTAPPAQADQTIGWPTFTGAENPVPPEPSSYVKRGMMQAIYDQEKGGTDFWMDRMLARRGSDPAGNRLMTRGRAVFMKQHIPSIIGFGGQVAYWESISNQSAYTIGVGSAALTETVSQRLQTPSYWQSEHTGGSTRVLVRKYITHNNVAVTDLAITNTGDTAQTLELTVDSPYAKTAEGGELTGTVQSYNRLTTIFPRLSGDGLTPGNGRLTGSVTLDPGATARRKVVMGFVAEEIPASLEEYRQYRALDAEEAFARHVRTYNRWWAENLPYIDVPDGNVKKSIYYRWWLMRYNFLDADIPGNDYQFPTSMEGVLGYNNAIVLTIGMFVDDLKYLRDPIYSYGPWVSAGEVSRNRRYTDNPGDPENWSNSYTQYISESAWQSYQVHGGQRDILRNLARYAEKDVYGQLDFYDQDGNGLIEYDWGALTGNDADAVSFDWRPGRLDRAESAYVYSNALAAAEAYDQLGEAAKADELRAVAARVRAAVLAHLWNPDRQLIEHRHVATDSHVPWKEINNYYPFSVGLMPNEPQYVQALRLFADEAEYPIFPFYTANQRDKAEAAEQGFPGSNNFSVINSTVQFRLFSSVLRQYPNQYMTAEMYKQLLYWNAWAHYIGGNNAWPDANEFWFNWNPITRQIDGRSGIHHTILGATNWTVIEDVMGLRPRSDDKLELWPIGIGWDHFAVNDINYRDDDLTIVWDQPGDGRSHYDGVPEGYSVFLDGRRAFTVDRLTHLVWDPRSGRVTFPSGDGTVLHSRSMRGVKAPSEVDLTGRAVEMFQKAGVDLSRTGGRPNLAAGAIAAASHTAEGTSTAAAVDGFTINEPFWGSRGSGNAADTYELDFGARTRFDDVKLYFYDDKYQGRYTKPAAYSVQYLDGDRWVDIPRQYKTPAYPQANYNHVRFPAVAAQKLRVRMTHQHGFASGLKEVQVFRTGTRPPKPRNRPPLVTVQEDPSFSRPAQARLLGVVRDDGLPGGALDVRWRVLDGPGVAIFDDPAASTTVARFTQGGTYVLELAASDGALSASASVTVTVDPLGDLVNVAPFATPSASYTSPWERVAAINDGIDPPRSNDTQNPRWGTWPEEGTQWVQLDFDHPVKVDSSDVYFFDDNGGVRVPASWKIQYWDGDAFVDVPAASGYQVQVDRYNRVTFGAVTTSRLRLELESGAASVGILEWKAYAVPPAALRPVHVRTLVDQQPALPSTVTRIYDDGSRLAAPVSWQPATPEQLRTPGTQFELVGLVEGTNLIANATVYVRDTNAVSITFIKPEQLVTLVGVPPALPETVQATFNDGSVDSVNVHVAWEEVDPSRYAQPGTFTVTGTVEGTSLAARADVTVLAEPPG